jgi:hypothetical protein
MALLAFRRLVLGIVPFLLFAAGCSAGGDGEVRDEDDGDDGTPREAIAFDAVMVPVRLAPLEQRRIPVVVAPPGAREVRFALLAGANGEPNGALLDRDVVSTDEEGRAEVILTAPSAPTAFVLRATMGSASTSVDVEISASNEVKLRVEPSYDSDRDSDRDPKFWSVSVFSGVTCETLPETTATAERYAEGEFPLAITVEAVPVGSVAVVARAEHFIEGCATLNEVLEGANNRLLVPMNDRPIQLQSSKLELGFGFDSVSSEWRASMGFVIEAARTALLNGAADDFEALLDTMQGSLSGSRASEFAALRTERSWDLVLAETLGEEGRDLLREKAEAWMREGQQTLFFPDAIEASMQSDTAAKDDLPGATHALMRFVDIAGHAPEEAGFPEEAPAVWSADSHDTVLLSGAVPWVPSRLLGALAEAPAKVAHPTAQTTAEALAFELGCSVVASALVTASPGWLYGPSGDDKACTGTCAAKLCRAAVAEMWERATLASGDTPQQFDFSATGAATVGNEGEVVLLENGSWVGKDRDQTEAATAGGPLYGTAP